MGDGAEAQVLQRPRQGHVLELPAAAAREHQGTAVAQPPRRLEQLDGAPAQRHPVLAVRLHAARRHRPHPAGPVHLGPPRPAHLARPRRRQHQKLERQLHDRPHLGPLNRLDRRRHLAVGQGRHVLDARALPAQHLLDALAGVVGPELHGHRPLHHRVQALAQPPGRRRRPVPHRGQRLDDIGAGHLGQPHAAEARKGVALQARQPVAAVLPVSPARPHLAPHPLGRLGEGGHAARPPLLGQGVAAGAGEPAVVDGPRPGLVERHQREAAQPQLAPPAMDEEPLHPAPAARRLHVEVQPVAVAVAAGRNDRAHEGLRERIPRMSLSRCLQSRFVFTLLPSTSPSSVAAFHRSSRRYPA